jgi:serine/threonine-protein kinase
MNDRPVGNSIGKYRVVKLLGEGSMGIVYAAYDPSLDRHVAIKVIRNDIIDRRMAAHITARFRNEAMAAGRLQHPGIVSVYEFGEDLGSSFIAMEYAPGEDLEEYGRKYAPVGLPELAGLMTQLLDALQYAHSSGVVHRDIKPSNLILTADGRLKITDFGIARIATSKLTQTGAAMGTPMYMAPEQYTGAGVDHRADLFSAGVLFYELLTGQRPFEGDSIQEVAYKICHADPVRPTQHDPFLPPAIDACVMKALAKDKSSRYATAQEFARAIADAIASGQFFSTAARSATVFSWPAEAAKALASVLLPAVGPLAGALVRRSLARTHDRNELLEALRRGAGDQADNPTLLRNLRAALDGSLGVGGPLTKTPQPIAPTPPSGHPASPPSRGLTPDDLERATQALVGSVGPIAKVLVKKAAAQARDFQDLCVRLSEHLASDQERAQFLQKVSVR